ncbi:MAG: hypothetical protein CVU65_00510 [Deltaproteobacteria bacterium HGW-Deltaproteobacteria-22]|jgi:excinuclease ABC subunit A|nr:MAG: hypothetical protein CVU65_00510 [Deltaproteobacteria bacterium HGW-Deltaproteobacteria-22]
MKIALFGVTTHNLKDIDVEIPWGKITAIVGVSGSGKSSLAHDTLYVEGQLRYLETLSLRMRPWFSGRLIRPQVRWASGLSPTVLVSQKSQTWADATCVSDALETSHHLRFLFTHLGIVRCPECGLEVRASDIADVAAFCAELPLGTRLWVTAPFSRELDEELLRDLLETGFTRVFAGDQEYDLEEPGQQPSGPFSVVVDRVVTREGQQSRLAGSVEQAFRIAGGQVQIRTAEGVTAFSTRPQCTGCGRVFARKTPRLFSRDPETGGGCPSCGGNRLVEGQVCAACGGSGHSDELAAYSVSGVSWPAWQELTVDEALAQCRGVLDAQADPHRLAAASSLIAPIERRLRFLADLDLGGLRLSRPMNTLSHGQTQFVRLSAHLAGELSGVTTILDEPGMGLARDEKTKLKGIFERLIDQKNTVVLVEHDPELIALCDHVIELGPGAGELGGEVLYAGDRAGLAACPESRISPWLMDFSGMPPAVERPAPEAMLRFPEVTVRELTFDEVALPFSRWTVLTGPMACGKSTFLTAVAAAQGRLVAAQRTRNSRAEVATGGGFFPGGVKMLDELSFPRTPHSHVASLCGIWDVLRRWYAQLPLAKARGYDAARFSTTRAGDGRCLRCSGTGEILVDTGGLSQLATVCPLCEGRRYTPQTLEITWRGYSIADVLAHTVREALGLFSHFPEISSRLTLLSEVGLEYLRLGQPSRSLSGGEMQRLALARELVSKQPSCFLLDEPLGGLHPDDVVHLVRLFQRLVDQGHTLITVDHTGWLIPCADLHLRLHRAGDRVSFI